MQLAPPDGWVMEAVCAYFATSMAPIMTGWKTSAMPTLHRVNFGHSHQASLNFAWDECIHSWPKILFFKYIFLNQYHDIDLKKYSSIIIIVLTKMLFSVIGAEVDGNIEVEQDGPLWNTCMNH